MGPFALRRHAFGPLLAGTPGRVRRAFPRVSIIGVAVMLAGLLADLVEHTLVGHEDEAAFAGFPVTEHLAHFVVIVGMVLVLSGIVADGVRSGRRARQERS